MQIKGFGKILAQIIVGILLLTLTLSFSYNDPTNWSDYLLSFKEWKKERVENLKKPMGYLSMTGLYWLNEGVQSMGSDTDNDLVFPSELPKDIGQLNLNNGKLFFETENNEITINGDSSSDQSINSDADGEASMFNWNSHFWYVIKRGDQYGVRLKDTLADARMNITNVPTYKPQQQWVIKGKFEASTENSKVSITNKVGITYDRDLAGSVVFKYSDEEHDLLATTSGERLFIVFADLTNGTKTYGGGRFLYVDIPEKGNEVILDFNRAENPICGFSDYATCPLPRPENFLPFKVDAGEKKVR